MAGKLPVTKRSTLGSQGGSSFGKVPLNLFKNGRLIFLGILLFVVVGCVFLPSLRNDFVQWDDDINIYGNPHIQKLDGPHLRWMFTDCSYIRRYVPVTWLNWALVYHFFGLNPAVFHLESLLLHAANAVLVFVLIRKLLQRVFQSAGDASAWTASRASVPRTLPFCEPRPATMDPAGMAALLWALHPLRTEAVVWASGIYPQSIFLLLLSLLYYLRSLEGAVGVSLFHTLRYWLAVLFYTLSLLTYPIGMPFLIVLLVLSIYPLGRLPACVAGWSKDLGRG